MSKAKTPTLPWAIPMYDYMQKHLLTASTNVALPFKFQEAALAGLEKLERYYKMARLNQFNIVSTGESL